MSKGIVGIKLGSGQELALEVQYTMLSVFYVMQAASLLWLMEVVRSPPAPR